MATKSISVEKPDKKNRTRLTELEGLAQALLRSAGLGIYIVQEGKFQYVNPLFQGLTGYIEEELLGTYSLNLVHPEDRETVRRKAVENLKGQATYPYEYRLIKRNGDLVWVLENIVTVEYKGRPVSHPRYQRLEWWVSAEHRRAVSYARRRVYIHRTNGTD